MTRHEGEKRWGCQQRAALAGRARLCKYAKGVRRHMATLTPQQIAQFRRDGTLIIEGLVPPAVTEGWRQTTGNKADGGQ